MGVPFVSSMEEFNVKIDFGLFCTQKMNTTSHLEWDDSNMQFERLETIGNATCRNHLLVFVCNISITAAMIL